MEIVIDVVVGVDVVIAAANAILAWFKTPES
jgi:hypothetical protein